MIDIGREIEFLLTTHDCVILPDFGGFVATYVSAAYDHENRQMLPPNKSVIFDTKLLRGNDLLANHIVSKFGKSLADAQQVINDFAKKCMEKLDLGEEVQIGQMGQLFRDKAYRTHFRQDEKRNLLTQAFGFEEIEVPENLEVEREENEYRSDGWSDNRSLRYRGRRRIILPVAIIIIVLIIPLYFIINHFPIEGGGEFENNFKINDTTITSKSGRIVLGPRAGAGDASIERKIDSLTKKENALLLNQAQVAEYKEFHLIAGSFKSLLNAQKLEEELREKGLEPSTIRTDEMYRVSLGVYANRQEALDELYRLRERFNNQAIWLLSKK